MILASIMVAGGVTFAIPGAVPEAAAQSSNANLYVSAENAMFDNVFTGLNVIEVVVRDPSINDRGGPDDTPSAEPRVEVDGDQLRMVQGNDGNWYGYFAENNTRMIDETGAIDYGDDECDIGISTYSEVLMCRPMGENTHPVIRTSKAINDPSEWEDNDNIGSIGIPDDKKDMWPFIQVYDFDDESSIVVEYQRGGDAQSVSLYYDSDPDEYGTGLELGRDRYPLGGGVIMTMTDLAMNVDPTDSDTWTFVTNGSQVAYYYLFDDNGVCQDGNQGAISRDDVEGIDDNLYLTIDPAKDGSKVLDFVVPLKGNQEYGCGEGSTVRMLMDAQIQYGTNNMVTFIEGDPGVFMNTDSNEDVPNIVVPPTAARGNTAVIDHNDGDISVVVGNTFATIEIDSDAVGGVWNSGEEVPVTLTDPDVNRKAMNDEDIDVSNPIFTIIPSVRIGSPITLANGILDVNTRMINFTTNNQTYTLAPVDKFSDIARLQPVESGNTLTVMGISTGEDLVEFLKDDAPQPRFIRGSIGPTAVAPPATFQFLNIDARSIGNLERAEFTVTWKNTSGKTEAYRVPLPIPDMDDNKGRVFVDISSVYEGIPGDNARVDIVLRFDEEMVVGTTYPIAIDLFSFGQKGDGVAAGDRINNAIYSHGHN